MQATACRNMELQTGPIMKRKVHVPVIMMHSSMTNCIRTPKNRQALENSISLPLLASHWEAYPLLISHGTTRKRLIRLAYSRDLSGGVISLLKTAAILMMI